MNWGIVMVVMLGAAQSPFDSVQPAVRDTLTFREALPEFREKDLRGKVWTERDLRGRVTVVDIWATNCVPCRKEHPALQKFFEGQRDVRVLTISIDENALLTDDYMKDNGYTFPVIVSPKLAQRLFPARLMPNEGIPQVWVVDERGRRSEPFREWALRKVLGELERRYVKAVGSMR